MWGGYVVNGNGGKIEYGRENCLDERDDETPVHHKLTEPGGPFILKPSQEHNMHTSIMTSV